MTLSGTTAGLRRMFFWPLPIAVLLLLGACQGSSVKDGDAAAQGPDDVASTIYDPPTVIPAPPPGETALEAAKKDGRRIAVAILLPTSGQDGSIGKAMLDAAQLAVFDIADDDFRLTPYDTGGTPEGARAAAEKAIADGAKLILGPLFSTSVAEVAPLARDEGINLIAFSNNRAVADEGTYLIGFLPREQIARIVSYAGEQGARRFATLVPDTAFGAQVVADLRDAVTRFGGELTKVQTYAPELKDLSKPVRQLGDYNFRKQALADRMKVLRGDSSAAAQRELKTLANQETIGDVDYDAILLPQNGSSLKAIAALLPFYDIDTAKTQLLGLASWHQPGLGSEPPLVGAWYPAPQIEARYEFDKRFSDTYGYNPPLIATLAYDATALASVLARRDGGADFSGDALTVANGFAGTAGLFRFLPNGESQRSLAIMEVRASRIRVINPAPPTFRDITN